MDPVAFIPLVKGILPKVFEWLLQRFKARNPIECSAEHFVEDQWSVVFPGGREALSQLEGKRIPGPKLHFKLLRLGAVDFEETRIRLRLRAKTDAPVLVKEIVAQAAKSAPIEGIKITHPTAGVSDSTLLLIDFDDDGTELPLWSAIEESFEVRRDSPRPFFSRKQISLSKTGYETLIIIAKTCRHSVSWTLRICYEVNGVEGIVEIDDKGKPFRTSGVPLEGCSSDLTWAWFDDHKLRPTHNIEVD